MFLRYFSGLTVTHTVAEDMTVEHVDLYIDGKHSNRGVLGESYF